MKKVNFVAVAVVAMSLSGCLGTGASDNIAESILRGIGIKQKGPMYAKLISISAQTLRVNEDKISIPGTLTTNGTLSIWNPVRNSDGSTIYCSAQGEIRLINTTCVEGQKIFLGRDVVNNN